MSRKRYTSTCSNCMVKYISKSKKSKYCSSNCRLKSFTLKPKLQNKNVDHPSHYGGENNPYEAIKVIEHYNLNFHLGNTIKYILRAGKKNPNEIIQDLEKAKWYLQRAIEKCS